MFAPFCLTLVPVPVPNDPLESEVEEYFQCFTSNESDYDGDSEFIDD